jgi:hypothetical protein
MAYGKKLWVYPAAAVLLAVLVIGATAIYMNLNTKKPSNTYSVLAISLTDPPHVPDGTQWLNVTFTQISLLVSEPTGSGGQVTTTTVTVTPTGNSATIDLLSLQNYTETVGEASLPQGSVVYSLTLTVTSIKIDVNGTVSQVALATGSNNLQAVIANPKSLSGDNEALIQLNPVVVSTPSGYQLIPSTVAVVAPSSGAHVGGVSKLSQQEEQELEEAQGNLSVKVVALNVKGTVTNFTLLVNNTGKVPVQLVAVGLHGDFNVTGSACRAGQNESGNHDNNSQGNNDMGQLNNDMGDQHGSSDSGDHGDSGAMGDHGGCEHPDEVVFTPINTSMTAASSTSTTSTTPSVAKCSLFNLSVVGSQDGNDNAQGDEGSQPAGIVIQPGQCVELVFNGTIGFGSSNLTLVPSLTPGSVYTVHIIASNGAEQKLSCSVPVGPSSCTPTNREDNEDD